MPSEKVLSEKKAIVAALAEKIKASGTGVLVDYKGLTVAEDTELRKALRAAGVEYAFMGEAGHCEPLYAAGFEHGKYARGAAVGEDKACGGA